ncbi:MAG TPA: hypothetical protein VK815_09300 [Candidatus Acidoferrales bacterium]|nr:hypothetical protein [Candidatus Acidoferrales bacterium]
MKTKLCNHRPPPIDSRIEPMNQSAAFLPRRGNCFSLSPGERAGVRVSVKQIIPGAFTRIVARYFARLPLRVNGEGERAANRYAPFSAATLLND